jgi:hypothetical protein
MQIREKGSKIQLLRSWWDKDSKRTRQKMALSVCITTKKLSFEQTEAGNFTTEEVAEFDLYVSQRDASMDRWRETSSVKNLIEHIGHFKKLSTRQDKKLLKQTDVNKLERELIKAMEVLVENGYKVKNLKW